MHNITIETERLILRPLATADAEAVFEWVSDERVKYRSRFKRRRLLVLRI